MSGQYLAIKNAWKETQKANFLTTEFQFQLFDVFVCL